MRVKHTLLLIFFMFFGTAFSNAWGVAPFSKYGNIQNVQTYSSNPFWTPDAPYNQRMPTPVYATGTDIETTDCQRVTTNLVAAICATMNDCANATLSDIRPTLITQMSRMPGGNYATACAGYLDTAFSDYVRKYAHAGANIAGATFPTATIPTPTVQNTGTQVAFPEKQPEWAMDVQRREQELQNLKATGPSAFPTTYADLSFTERMQNAAEGYAPFKDTSAYKPIKIDTSSTTQKNASGKTEINTQKNTITQPQKPLLSNNPTETVPGEILFTL